MFRRYLAKRYASRLRRAARRMRRDERGLAATEFAFIVPLMLVMFFGVVEMSSGIAVDRKVTLVARTISDLVSQASTVTNSDFDNIFAAGGLVMWPFGATPIRATISELYIDPSNGQAKVMWNKGSTVRATNSVVSIPAGLIARDSSGNVLPNQYLIYSEVSYLYVPAVGYIMNKNGVTLSDVNYTRPRQSTCVLYGTATCPT